MNKNERPDPINAEQESGSLCLSCGICCKGFLHQVASLKPDEVSAARRLGLETFDTDEPYFSLPCPRFEGRCTVYQERPSPCSGFRCALLRRLDAGEITLEEGRNVVGEAHRLIDRARTTVSPDDLLGRYRAHFRRSIVTQDTPAQKLQLTALALYFDKHFVLERDGYFLSEAPVEAKEFE